MKNLLVTLLFLYPVILFSQSYTRSIDDINKATEAIPINDKGNIIDLNNTDFSADAIISITGLSSNPTETIKLQYGSPVKDVKGIFKEGSFVFSLSQDELIASNGKFNLLSEGKVKATFEFKLISKKDAGDLGKGKTDDPTSYVAALANANFVGNNKFLANLTPAVSLGEIVNLKKNKDENFRWDLDVNPYIGSQIDTKDSSSFIPALMLYGRAGLGLNNYLTWGKEGKTRLILMPLGFGLKLIPNVKDSNTIIVQHNLRTGIAIQIPNVLLIGLQYTHGFHNSTSESKIFYNKTFGNNTTDIEYLTISGQFSVKGKTQDVTNYVFIEWRALLNKQSYSAFTNNAIITFGIRKDLSLSSVFASSTNASSTGTSASKPVMRTRPLF